MTRAIAAMLLAVCAAVSVGTHAPRSTDWRQQLDALTPSDPAGYLRAGELALANAAAGTTPRSHAVHLLVLAVGLGSESDHPEIAASACLALATVPDLRVDRPWLLSLAARLAPSAAGSRWRGNNHAAAPAEERVEADAARALLTLRAGQIAAYRALTRDERVASRLAAVPELIEAAAPHTVSDWLTELAGRWPCAVCRNTGIERSNDNGHRRESVCSRCNGHPGPGSTLTPIELGLVLRAESRLLNEHQTSWTLSLALSDGAPYRPPTPRALAAALGVDLDKTVYRAGAWVRPPEEDQGNAP